MSHISLSEFWFSARRAGTPLLSVESHDEIGACRLLSAYARQELFQEELYPAPTWIWTCAGGFVAQDEVSKDIGLERIDQIEDALIEIGKHESIPQRSVFLLQWRTEFWQSPVCRQALVNLRDLLKRKGESVVLVLPYGSEVPGDVAVHCIRYREELPSSIELGEIAQKGHKVAQRAAQRLGQDIPPLAAEQEESIVSALQGMNSFQAEQQVYMALSKEEGIELSKIQQSKIDLINDTPGLQVWQGGESFDSIAGNEGVKSYFRALLGGRLPIRLVIWVDEAEDMMAGKDGDLTGISMAYQGRLAGHIEDTKAQCILAYGHPGTGKSLTAKAVAHEAKCLCISLDLGTMKGSLVGQSEAQLSRALAMERAIVGNELGATLWVWTTNDPSKLDAKIRARMQAEFFYDSPTEQERLAIWSLYRGKYDLELQAYPNDEGYTGREIERCCRLAWQMRLSLVEASEYIVSRSVVDAGEIQERRKKAHMKYLSAQMTGKYMMPQVEQEERKVSL